LRGDETGLLNPKKNNECTEKGAGEKARQGIAGESKGKKDLRLGEEGAPDGRPRGDTEGGKLMNPRKQAHNCAVKRAENGSFRSHVES